MTHEELVIRVAELEKQLSELQARPVYYPAPYPVPVPGYPPSFTPHWPTIWCGPAGEPNKVFLQNTAAQPTATYGFAP